MRRENRRKKERKESVLKHACMLLVLPSVKRESERGEEGKKSRERHIIMKTDGEREREERKGLGSGRFNFYERNASHKRKSNESVTQLFEIGGKVQVS